MPYRIVQIEKVYAYGPPLVTVDCYAVLKYSYETPEAAHADIKMFSDGKYPGDHVTQEDWFIVIQTF